MDSRVWAVSYMRCSGRGQVDGDTWDRQSGEISAYAIAQDFTVLSEFRDEGVSGKTELEGRTGLTELLAYLQVETRCKLVLVESSDRLARDSLVAEIIIREFQKLGVRVIAAAGGVDLTSGSDLNPTAKLIRQILAAIAEFDRCVTVNKLRAARERVKAKTGRCEGRKPYGETEAERTTMELMTQMRERGRSYGYIAQFLNDNNSLARHGKPWHQSSIAKIHDRWVLANKITEKSQ